MSVQCNIKYVSVTGYFHVVSKYRQYVLSSLHKHACDGQTDGQTDGQNYDPRNRASIAASRGNKINQQSIYAYKAEVEHQ